MKYFRTKLITGLILIFVVSLITACSNSHSNTEPVVKTVIDSIEELNSALNSDTDKIDFAADITGDAVINDRGEDLIIDLKGFTLTGSLTVNSDSNS